MSPRKRHPKKPKRSFVETNNTSSSAGGFLRRAYKSFQEYLTFSDEINALECTPEGLAKLAESALGLREELNHSLRDELERHRSIAETIDLENLGSRTEPLNWEPLLRYVDQELLRHYWFSMVLHPIPPSDWGLPRDELTKKHGDKLDALKKKLDGELRGFANLVNDLVEQSVNIPKIFFIAMVKEAEEIRCQVMWQTWNARYRVVADKAKKFKKQCYLHRNAIRSSTELGSTLRNQIQRQTQRKFEAVFVLLDSVIAKQWLKERDRKYRRPKGHARKHPVWTPVLKELEGELIPHFQPEKHWELPGGFPGSAIPNKVYKTINGVVHYFYPSIWESDPETTAAIKSRCQRSPSSNP